MTIKSLVTKAVTSSLIFASASSFAAVTQDQVVEHYADIAHAVFADSVITAKALNSSIDTFLTSPSASNFEQVKQAWLESRVPYQQSEVFRFGNVVVDDWEGQLNAWPLDEGLIDYVSSDYQYELGNEGASANIVANKTFQIGQTTVDATNITPELIADLNEIGGSEANVASGYHAIEFLLWGQDLNGTNSGAGERAYTDFVVGAECTNGNCDRRGAYLKASAELLIQDLEWMEKQWAEGEKGNYRQELLSESSDNGLRKMLFGMGSLSLGELAGERMKVALEANSTEDEHDCFSDNTHNSHYYNEQGIYNVYTGLYKREDGTLLSGPSLFDLVEQKDEQAAKEIQKQFDLARAQVGQLVTSAEKNNQHFDQLIAADNAAGNALVNKTIVALVSQTAAIERAAGVIGIDSLNPDTADHEF
ncbi:imelysin family protein [Vibrio crassostreae]|uniref:imelysin family protein n=1 Tax=Vibrio crassostreae TaxID=246167 RepID=UPI000F47D824|nr:imelysin family protein [Vibrio crassostreae]ROP25508.1 putative iron-regulated protein [Vibrio crassostreae]ROP26288.1 putative iron-regulated protein [Vibrio crassostreae]RPF00857.1 putative iron-regulated protein [Vibrio crassostreae]RPF10613.1 putative iron-regulated protein [Vibrio crassostreae]TCN73536.1 putative iron-regulated protein [Vibrio crassostreae]